jgi:hypothetical protein
MKKDMGTHMQANTILSELNANIELTIKYKLIDNHMYTEIKFTCDKHGQASVIETWRCPKRLKTDYVAVQIPSYLLKYFIFKNIV